jgi:threonine synthase
MLEVRRRLGLRPDLTEAPLAIASCGNAALAAAVLAKAAGRALHVFVPPDADPDTLDRLRGLDATIETCPRTGDAPGDPCVRRFRAAVEAGAIPFSCQGPADGLVIDGGRTVAWELADAASAAGVALDRVLVPVGGGALASAVVAGLRDAVRLGALDRLPRLHPVQTEGGWPLVRAWEAVVERMRATGEPHDAVLRWAARHRSAFMWPWETTPASLATGILDDETWDWRAVLEGTLASGGAPVVVGDDDLRRASTLAEAAVAAGDLPRAPGYTGVAALAALAKLRASGEVGPDERVAVLVTGVRRGRGG